MISSNQVLCARLLSILSVHRNSVANVPRFCETIICVPPNHSKPINSWDFVLDMTPSLYNGPNKREGVLVEFSHSFLDPLGPYACPDEIK
jgi:hypothetical protein